MKFDLLLPKKYLVRIIFDENNNGIWDTGNFLKKFQPEMVQYFTEPIEVRANWDIEQPIILK